jgi:hypothetical protein
MRNDVVGRWIDYEINQRMLRGLGRNASQSYLFMTVKMNTITKSFGLS